jgi:type IV pilus assembly protein PilA
MKLNRSKKGFTLVEIMIVVVIIGLLAAMAIPAFQKVRRNSLGKTMANDARQIGAAMQQISLNYPGIANGATVAIAVAADGAITHPVIPIAAGGTVPADEVATYVKKISRGYLTPITYTFGVAAGAAAFTMTNPQIAPTDVITNSSFAANQISVPTAAGVAVSFDEEGKAL